jgi:hypothetical protein
MVVADGEGGGKEGRGDGEGLDLFFEAALNLWERFRRVRYRFAWYLLGDTARWSACRGSPGRLRITGALVMSKGLLGARMSL